MLVPETRWQFVPGVGGGHYILEIGMYQRATGKRTEIFERGERLGDQLAVGELEVW